MNKNNCGCAMMQSMKKRSSKSRSPTKNRSRSGSRGRMHGHRSRSGSRGRMHGHRSRSGSRGRMHGRMHGHRSRSGSRGRMHGHRSRSGSRERKSHFLKSKIPMIPSMSGMSYVADEWADVTNINCDQNITGYARIGTTWPSCHSCDGGQVQRRC